MTKKQARERKAEWQRALAEGRVVKFDNGLTFTAYMTQAQALAAQDAARQAGRAASVVVA